VHVSWRKMHAGDIGCDAFRFVQELGGQWGAARRRQRMATQRCAGPSTVHTLSVSSCLRELLKARKRKEKRRRQKARAREAAAAVAAVAHCFLL
jgi:hypothetical protein